MQIHILGRPQTWNDTLRSHSDALAHLILGRVSSRIGQLKIHLEDLEAPRGGIDKHCHAFAKLIPHGEVSVSGMGTDWEVLLQNTLRRLGRTIVRKLESQRPLRGRRLNH